jgi:hypothetical protein
MYMTYKDKGMGCSRNYPLIMGGVDGRHFFVLRVEESAQFYVLGMVGVSGGGVGWLHSWSVLGVRGLEI